MRNLKVGEIVVFNAENKNAAQLASGNAGCLDGKFQFKTASLVDPVTCLAVRVLIVTRKS